MRADQLMKLIRQLTDPDTRQRELGADRVTDWVSSYSKTERRLLAGILSISAACEQHHGTLEAQLHALLELGASGLTNFESIAHLREIDLTTLPGSLSEYVEDLLNTS
ncbi:hypothetical protein [Streptomyces sp. H27-D2]|uniref:hypothetical protein n=1 Tax=Streptomyces sp. H27-D2 TaxID=3046304 RepID=UPI002DBCB01C|nr:hypothetical protein [Streptomyces sp. H27-D2]MEC4014878.1 hypothetical protein [Streptomyces sp. H27-D2]